jgi:hypothetical protein
VNGAARGLFVLLLVLAGGVILWSAPELPDPVAVHFSSAGANGYMGRDSYLRFAVLLVLIVPLALSLLPSLVLRDPNAQLRVPNADYWLAPGRRSRAVGMVRHYLTHCASILLVFLAYAHWLVVCANARVPPSLPMTWVLAGLIGLTVAILLWTRRFLGAFRV